MGRGRGASYRPSSDVDPTHMIPRGERRRNRQARQPETASYASERASEPERPQIDSYMPDRAREPEIPQYDSYIPDRTREPEVPQQYDSYMPDRATQIRQVDSWRSYRNDAVNLQTLANPQFSQSQAVLSRVYHQESQQLDATAPPFQSLNGTGSYYTPYQPLRVSDGTRERQIIQQAQRALELSNPPTTSRYSFRHRRPDQIAQFSAALSPDIPLLSIEAANPPSNLASLPRAYSTARRRAPTPQVKSPPPPVASDKYKRDSELPPALRQRPQKLLVVLDLNGTLLVRPRSSAPKKFVLRPGVLQLLDYLFENHVVMVYSSAMPENTVAMVASLVHPSKRKQMAAVWGRDKLDLSKAQYVNKVQVYKKLQKIWGDKSIQSKAEPGRRWDQSNTVLVDDSQLKALSQPHNLLQVPEFENNAPKQGGQVLREWQLQQQEIVKSVQLKLEELKWQVDVSRLIRQWQTGKRQAPGVVDETVDQKTHHSVDERAPSPTPSVGQPEAEGEQLLTPRSPPRSESATPDYEPAGGVNLDDSGVSTVDGLMRNFDRNLNFQTTPDSDARRSESPIGEHVWAEMLNGANNPGQNKQGAEKGKEKENSPGLRDVPPTPESMGA